MPIRLTTPETINIDGFPVEATHVELANFHVDTGDRVTTNVGTFTMRYGNMVDPGDGSPLRFQGIMGAERVFERRYIPETTVGGFNSDTGEYETVVTPADNQPMEIVGFMGVSPDLSALVQAELDDGLTAGDDAAALTARVETVLTGKGMHMLYVGVYFWLLTHGHFAGTPE